MLLQPHQVKSANAPKNPVSKFPGTTTSSTGVWNGVPSSQSPRTMNKHFVELMCSYAQEYGIQIHNYCLMGNHFHLLLEIPRPVLSKSMRRLGMNYAIYFNKKIPPQRPSLAGALPVAVRHR